MVPEVAVDIAFMKDEAIPFILLAGSPSKDGVENIERLGKGELGTETEALPDEPGADVSNFAADVMPIGVAKEAFRADAGAL